MTFFRKLIVCALFLPLTLLSEEVALLVTDSSANNALPLQRSDNIPQTHLAGQDDAYLTGYLQSLVDMHYCEFGVIVEVSGPKVYVSNLPKNECVKESIISFIGNIPCVEEVVVVAPCCEMWTPPCENMLSPLREAKGIWLPQMTVLFQPLVADPRQVTNSAALRFNDKAIGKHVGAVSFGDEFIVYRWLDLWKWHGDLEWGVEAGVFAVFDLDHPEACHTNTDFFVAGLLNYALDRTSFRFRLWHLSSHLGDEFLLSLPNPHAHRKNLSDEGVDLFISYQFCRPVRLYAGIGDIFDRDKSFPEKPIYFEFGTEIRVFGERDCFNKLYVQPFLAMHFRTWQEHNWSLDQTYCLGVEWSKLQGVGRKFRIFGEYHDGFSKEGQFCKFRTHYAAVRLEYGF